ncbi:PepSY domain-containing protein [Aurantiacibacter xanthus]|uniref:PepSY domain-containing protein n=1 Tax=Aurantiacibacter xanthus TaxID=1784712 RepID=A0A3A1P6T4_9SPHN|nr:PepSY-associated TM helix domain-containing protein [Aurantiacibacter xanthus]RIV84141.1 PepSY domain-containing protein [Aurantiacibacter xanthus]
MRAALWKVHRWIGLACLAPFLILTLTGIGLLLLPAWPKGAASPLAPAGIDRAVAEANHCFPQAQIGLIMPGLSPAKEWTLALREGDGIGRTLTFDPRDGRVLAEARSGSSLRDILLDLHNSLLIGLPGKLVMLAASLGLLTLAITGLAIMRRRLRVLRRAPWHGAYPLASLHKWTGLVALAFLLLLSVTGAMLLAFKTLGDLRSGPERSAPRAIEQVRPDNLAAMTSTALALHPGAEIQGIMPGGGDGPVAIMLLDRSAAPWAKSRTLMLDRQSGQPLPARPVPAFMQVMIAAKSLHTGLWSSAAVRGLYLACALLCGVLACSGLFLWLQRRRLRRSLPSASKAAHS